MVKIKMCKVMNWPFIFHFFLVTLSVSVASQESVEFFILDDSSSSSNPQAFAAVLPNEQLKAVSDTVLTAENWTRTNVLAYYPSINITTIVVGDNVLCQKGQEHYFRLVLFGIKNIYYSLTRWGLEKEIKVSSFFSSSCVYLDFEKFRDEFAESHIKPILSFLQETDSIYLISPSISWQKSHFLALKNLGFSNFIVKIPKKAQLTRRKLSSVVYSEPFSPTASPAATTTTALPPLAGKISPSPFYQPPLINPASPPFGLHLPPCNPSNIGGPAAAPPETEVRNELWCVAKPNVPQEVLQEAMDYACGDGGANCEAITPQGSCYYPNTVVAHASYAFNSYWQKTKNNGGSCGFGGTAMVISSDPSYRHCRFVLA